jgi:hypothetical protein
LLGENKPFARISIDLKLGALDPIGPKHPKSCCSSHQPAMMGRESRKVSEIGQMMRSLSASFGSG